MVATKLPLSLLYMCTNTFIVGAYLYVPERQEIAAATKYVSCVGRKVL